MADDTYMPKIYRKQHPNQTEEMVVAAGGKINLEDTTSEFGFVSEDFNGQQMRGLARNTADALTITNLSTASTTLSTLGGSVPTVFPSTYRVIKISCTSTLVGGSARLFSAEAGRLLTIRYTVNAANSNGLSIYCSGNVSGISGVRVLASTGSDLSCLMITTSAESYGYLILQAEEDGVWSVLSSKLVTEQSA